MWIKTTAPYAFLSAHIYIIGPILLAIVNYPASYETREDEYYNIVELVDKAGRMLMKLQPPRIDKLKIHNT